LLALDPGLRACGVALFRHAYAREGAGALDFTGELLAAAYVRAGEKDSDVLAAAERMARGVCSWVHQHRAGAMLDGLPIDLIAEWPRVYRAGHAKVGADPNDLLALTAVNGGVAALLGCNVSSVEPRTWKGTLGENSAGEYLVELRVKERLTDAELNRVHVPTARSLAHNVYDAVGIGLHHVGRGIVTTRTRVFAR
jgi:hypothetical protein